MSRFWLVWYRVRNYIVDLLAEMGARTALSIFLGVVMLIVLVRAAFAVEILDDGRAVFTHEEVQFIGEYARALEAENAQLKAALKAAKDTKCL